VAEVAAQPVGDTRSAILDIAERLVQSRGFNGFSYADVASELGVTKAALHYHFAGKAELGESLIARYAARFHDALVAIELGPEGEADKLRAYCDVYRAAIRDDRMCLCGMLAAEFHTLPEPMRDAVTAFFRDNEAWLAALLEDGRAAGTLRFTGPSLPAAQAIIAALEGAMLVGRPYRNTDVLDAVITRTCVEFATTTSRRRRAGTSGRS
jgi:TetR/AcrR family transcriptional repressor of nem operon